MKILNKKKSSNQTTLQLETSEADIKVHKKLQHSMYNVTDVNRSPKKCADITIKLNTTKIKNSHYQKQSISNFINTSIQEISIPNSMPANKTIDHRSNTNGTNPSLK